MYNKVQSQKDLEERFAEFLKGVNNTHYGKGGDEVIKFESCDFESLSFHGSHIVTQDEINALDHMHGGTIAWYLEAGAGFLASVYAGAFIPTADMHIHFMRSPSLGDKLDIHSRILRAGSKMIVIRCEIYCEGKIYATSESTSFIID